MPQLKLLVLLFSILFIGLGPMTPSAYLATRTNYPPISSTTFELKDLYHFDLPILGKPLATKQQCLNYLLSKNPLPQLALSPQELVNIFYEEGLREGVRPDIALAQSLHETGFFRYGGDVIAIQNNYAGLGTTGKGVKGAQFAQPRLGIRAQIQHLKGYATSTAPTIKIVDPRYELLRKTPSFGKTTTWQGLNGKWAVPGITYGQTILAIHQAILKVPK